VNEFPLFQRPKVRRYAAVAFVFVAALVLGAFGLRDCSREARDRAYAKHRVPLATAWKKHRSLLARAAALQPNFKEIDDEILPSRCRKLMDLIRRRYDVDPFHIEGRCDGSPATVELPVCEGARVFARVAASESQQGRRVGVIVQARRRHEEGGLHVVTLLLGAEHDLIEVHDLRFEGDSMQDDLASSTVRAVGPDGLFERKARGEHIELCATVPDGAVQLFREHRGEGDSVVRTRGAGATGWTEVHLLPSVGAWYGTPRGLTCFPPAWSDLEIRRRDGDVVCTLVRTNEGGDRKQWSRGPACPSRR